MPNEYSIEIHRHISKQVEHFKTGLAEADKTGDTATQQYCCGQLEELQWLRDYLKEHIDLKDFRYY